MDATEVGVAKVVTISEIDPADSATSTELAALQEQLRVPPVGCKGVCDVELYRSIYTEGKLLVLASWRDAAAVAPWQPPALVTDAGRVRHRSVRVIRDYGLMDRREAPQFYAAVARGGTRS